uniref:Uncharacterized protein n=2 Tax=Musa acuminata TaxID=4641 RepID=A0A804JBM6_MUSAM|nr:PREDICTED: uncharacterized protein LOC103986735 [Musa acuminata subsp. malaccensis]
MPPKDLPGFYYDVEKNRYFPIKGPIPGSKRPLVSSSVSCSSSKRATNGEFSNPYQDHQMHQASRRKLLKSSELLQVREIHGRSIVSNKYRCNFEQEYQKLQASYPMVWKYQNTVGVSDGALEQLHGIVQTPKGLQLQKFLTMGSMTGYISLYEVATVSQYFDYRFECIPKPIWSVRNPKTCDDSGIAGIWCLAESLPGFSSSISCIKKFSGNFSDTTQDGSSFRHAFLTLHMMTTFGSGAAGGSVYILNLHEPLDLILSSGSLFSHISQIASFDRTIWTADCNSHGTQAVIGTNLGATLINLETEEVSWFYRSRSDVFSQQFIHSGNVVLCGQRNGAVISVDIRQKQSRHKLGRNLNSSDAVFMSSAVCSLVALQSDDNYFLASSMDGSIKLFDCRLLQRGSVQSYAGHVNSHTRLQLGVNPSETFLISGGEDCFLRIWSIKNGELIFGEKVSDSILTTVCWPKTGNEFDGKQKSRKQLECCSEYSYFPTHSWGTWLGSPDGLFYMHGT